MRVAVYRETTVYNCRGKRSVYSPKIPQKASVVSENIPTASPDIN